MPKFEILCVTMHQRDFSKVEQMNIRSDVMFANQADRTAYEEIHIGEHRAGMITTKTRGVGVNRNTALLYAQGDICLFADDDVVYHDDAEQRILAEFDAHPDADVMIFHFDTDCPNRKQTKYPKTRKCGIFERFSWAGFRIAFRLNAVRKANLWFTTLFGGGCIFPSGEDSMWLQDARKAGLRIYVSKETIGHVSFEKSTWFSGYDERFFYGKGAFYATVHPRTFLPWCFYLTLRTGKYKGIPFFEKLRWMRRGRNGFRQMLSYKDYCCKMLNR